MANATVLRTGQANQATGSEDIDRVLFLKIFAGEVLNAFDTTTVTKGRHKVREIDHGKSATFPASWKVGSYEHVPGEELVFEQSNINEREIKIDSLIVSPVFLDVLEEKMNHWDSRGEYSHQAGHELAKRMDKNVLRQMSLAANAAATITGGPTGEVIGTAAGGQVSTLAATFLDMIWATLELMDDNDVPDGFVRQCFTRPAQWYLLIKDAQIGGSGNSPILNQDIGGAGSYSQGVMPMIGGVQMVKTTQIPDTDESADASVSLRHRGDFSNTVALMNTPECVGTVKLLDLMVESQYDMNRQGDMIVAKYAVGHGILRPECAFEFSDAIGESTADT